MKLRLRRVLYSDTPKARGHIPLSIYRQYVLKEVGGSTVRTDIILLDKCVVNTHAEYASSTSVLHKLIYAHLAVYISPTVFFSLVSLFNNVYLDREQQFSYFLILFSAICVYSQDIHY